MACVFQNIRHPDITMAKIFCSSGMVENLSNCSQYIQITITWNAIYIEKLPCHLHFYWIDFPCYSSLTEGKNVKNNEICESSFFWNEQLHASFLISKRQVIANHHYRDTFTVQLWNRVSNCRNERRPYLGRHDGE